MKIKKEKYESLRLELQEFTPQEYCATCWKIKVTCSTDSDYSYVKVGSNIYHHTGGPHSYTTIIDYSTQPTFDIIDSLDNSIVSATAGKNKGQAGSHSGYAWGSGSTWHFIASFDIPNTPNASE